ncbi:MAG: 16S rRNA (guanine(966)-N(2))-methyltransferase RsmD [Armatimonadetes bacterium]|nr:16S rRNA (guanine(966)-N(2))-methyltransferase RsmD [Armatimonadota bacterium]
MRTEARIVGGSAKGRVLHTGKGLAVRPTPAGLREALGSILRERLPGARVLDLFAGYGCTGLELLSRGAAFACFVERDGRAAELLRRNLAELGFAAQAEVRRETVERALSELAGRFDLVFVDPPYESGQAEATLVRLGGLPGLWSPGGQVIVQHSRREPLPLAAGGLRRFRERQTGDTVLSFYAEEETA